MFAYLAGNHHIWIRFLSVSSEPITTYVAIQSQLTKISNPSQVINQLWKVSGLAGASAFSKMTLAYIS